MRRPGYGQSEWFEISSGILLLFIAGGVSLFGGRGGLNGLFFGILIVGFASIFLSQVFIRQRWIRLFLISSGISAQLYVAFFALSTKDIIFFLLMVGWIFGMLISDKGVIEGLVKEGNAKKGFRPDLLAVVSGVTLLLIGTILTGASLWTEWLLPHTNHLLLGNSLYLIIAFVYVFAGVGLTIAELREWRSVHRLVMRALVAVLFGVIGTSYILAGSFIPATAFIGIALLTIIGKFAHRVHVEPAGIEGGSEENKMVYAYERAGRITIWLIILLFGFSSIIDNDSNPISFIAFCLIGLVSVLYYHLAPIAKYTKKNYLISLFVVTIAFDVYWWAHGALESSFTLLSFVLVVAAGVVVRPLWIVLMAGVVWFVPLANTLLASEYDLQKLGYYTISLMIITLYTFLTGERRINVIDELAKVNASMKESLTKEAKIQEQLVGKTKNVEKANKELVEMRSALLNVLEDVEKSNRQLKIDHHRQDAVFSSIGEGLVASDKNGKIILANLTATKILSVKLEDIVGKSIESVLKFYQPDSDILDTSVFDEVWSGKNGKLKDNLFLLNKEGRRIPIAGEASPFLDDREHISGIVLAFRDVTLEREIAQQKSSFISVASHQLRTPINAVRWYVDLLLGGDAGKLSKQQHEFIADISTSVVRMASLIDDLLKVSRAEEGKMHVDFEVVSPKNLVESSITEITAVTKSRKQRFEIEIPDDISDVRTDKENIREVLKNLLSNAAKYTPDGGKLGLRVSRSEKGVQFEIWDTGYGIPKEHQHHVFEKFYRGKRAVTMETVGTGLGLYIAKHIIEACNGSIWFESTEGEGSRFFFVLPAAEELKQA